MKVKLLTGRVGVNFSQRKGDVIDVDDAEGARMIAAGQAELVDPGPNPATVETAAVDSETVETPERKTRRRRRKDASAEVHAKEDVATEPVEPDRSAES